MKILLIKPIIKTYYVVIPPIGLGYISTIMLNSGHEVHEIYPKPIGGITT